MLKSNAVSALSRAFFVGTVLAGLAVVSASILRAQTPVPFQPPRIAPASNEGELAIKRFKLAPGLKADLFAAEPLFANPVAISTDEKGHWYVAETYRLHKGVTDIRGHMNWLDEELAARSTTDLAALFQRYRVKGLTDESERVRMIMDRDGDGRADHSTIFAEGFNTSVDGLAAGVLARHGDVWFANVPNLWWLRDTNGDGRADTRRSLHYGFGVRAGFIGHDLHGLRFGPDGKLYFSMGDRGLNVQTGQGAVVSLETGAILRCNPDGSGLEIFATGLRNPQELAFDEHGNLFTGENNSDGGDQARWVYLVEGGDSGWRIGWQFIERPNSRGPWNQEKLWHPQWDGQAAYILPPLLNLGNGPSGLAFYPGTGLPDRYRGHFFLADFRGAGQGSGVHAFTLKPKGASFEVANRHDFIWNVLATDVEFGVDGGLYVSDWVDGWAPPGKGRIYRVHDPALNRDPLVLETKKLLADGFEKRPVKELVALLNHRDMRVRQEAQFALAAQGQKTIATFAKIAAEGTNRLARLHAIWGLGQIEASVESARQKARAVAPLLPLLADSDVEVRSQAAKVLGDARSKDAFDNLVKLLSDLEARPRFFAAIALGKLRNPKAVQPLVEMLRANADQDRYLRHAGVVGLAGCASASVLEALGRDSSTAARMGALLAMRRLKTPAIAMFLNDADPLLVVEAARAINDVPIYDAQPQLAWLLKRHDLASLAQKVDIQTALLRRVVNANFRQGQPENAVALIDFAANASAPESIRAEALQLLGQWVRPSGRDAVVGFWRPLPMRDPSSIIELVAAKFDPLMSQPGEIPAAAAQMAGQLGLKQAGPQIFALMNAQTSTPGARVQALKALAAFKDLRLMEALQLARQDASETVRKEASRLQAQVQPGEAIAQLRGAIETGALSERQAAFATLVTLQDGKVDQIIGQWLDKLLAGQVPAELALDVIEAGKQRTAPEIAAKLRSYEDRRDPTDRLRAYRECLTGGNAEEGRKIFYERAEAQCFRCHKINGEGGEVGPDLTGFGAKQNREYTLEALTHPNAQIAPGFESVTVVLKSGTTYAGTLKSETSGELEIHSPEDGLVKVKKTDIQIRERGLSAMPEELRQVLSKSDLRDLVEFLGGLK